MTREPNRTSILPLVLLAAGAAVGMFAPFSRFAATLGEGVVLALNVAASLALMVAGLVAARRMRNRG